MEAARTAGLAVYGSTAHPLHKAAEHDNAYRARRGQLLTDAG